MKEIIISNEDLVHNEQSKMLEPIDMSELAMVFGGQSATEENKKGKDKSSGNAGGIVCWC